MRCYGWIDVYLIEDWKKYKLKKNTISRWTQTLIYSRCLAYINLLIPGFMIFFFKTFNWSAMADFWEIVVVVLKIVNITK